MATSQHLSSDDGGGGGGSSRQRASRLRGGVRCSTFSSAVAVVSDVCSSPLPPPTPLVPLLPPPRGGTRLSRAAVRHFRVARIGVRLLVLGIR